LNIANTIQSLVKRLDSEASRRQAEEERLHSRLNALEDQLRVAVTQPKSDTNRQDHTTRARPPHISDDLLRTLPESVLRSISPAAHRSYDGFSEGDGDHIDNSHGHYRKREEYPTYDGRIESNHILFVREVTELRDIKGSLTQKS
jgi:hypothetical protein